MRSPSLTVSIRNALCRLMYRSGMVRTGQPGHAPGPPTAILNYHRIGRTRFEGHVRYLQRHYTIASLKALIERGERNEPFPSPTVIITFDDGNVCCYTDVFPVLRMYGVPASIFLTTGHVDTPRLLWFDAVEHAVLHTARSSVACEGRVYPLRTSGQRRFAALQIIEYLKIRDEPTKWRLVEQVLDALGITPDAPGQEPYRCLTWAQVAEMADAGVDFGGHTVTHPILTRVSLDQAEREIAGSKREIEDRLARPAPHFAYPNGRQDDFNGDIIHLLKRHGCTCGLTTIPGYWAPASDAYALNRVIITDNMAPEALIVKLSGLWGRMMNAFGRPNTW